MTTVTQKIPNLLGGISQQPDNKKVPGQVRDSLNTFPEYALGLMKRPGGKFEAPLRGAVDGGNWFSIIGQDAKYIGQLHLSTVGPVFKLWYKESGIPRLVDYSSYEGYSNTASPLTTALTAETTAFSNLYGINGIQETYKNSIEAYCIAKEAAQEQLSSSFNIATVYNSDGTITRTIDTAVIKSGDEYNFYKDGAHLGTSTSTSLTVNTTDEYRVGTNRSEDNLNNTIYSPVNPLEYFQFGVLNGAVLYELVSVSPAQATPTVPSSITYTQAVSDLTTYQQATDTSISQVLSSAQRVVDKDYFTNDKDSAQLDVNNDIKFVTIQDTTFVLNKKKRVKWLESKTPEFKFDEAFINFNVLTSGNYGINVTRLVTDANGKEPHEEGYVRTEGSWTNGSTISVSTTQKTTVEAFRTQFNTNFVATGKFTTAEWARYVFETSGTGIYLASKPVPVFNYDEDQVFGINGTFANVAHVTDGFGTGLDISVNTDGSGKVSSIVINDPGTGYNVGENIQIDATNLGLTAGQGEDLILQIGSLSREQFEITVSGPTDAALSLLRHEVNDVGNLPVQTKNGYKVKVVNSTDVSVDDMYLVFQTEDGSDYSSGSWMESNAPGIYYIIDKTTMPHVLKPDTNGIFQFKAWDSWEDRKVGDEETNPTPHFITDGDNHRYINDIFLYRNRMGFLSGDSIILGRAGHFFDFFAKSSLATAPDDPIDSSVSTTNPVELFYTQQESVGLVIYGQSQQFLLTTESDLLSPTTAKINTLAGFNADPQLQSISLGSSSAFFSKTSDNTKFFELKNVSNVEAPQYAEKTKPVPELLPSTIDTVTASPAVSLVSFGQRGSAIVYNFNYYRTGGEEITNTWYRWELPGTLEYQFFDSNTYNTVIKSGTNYHLNSFRVAQSSSQGFIELESGTKTNLCLDMWYNEPVTTYDEVADETYILYPYTPLSSKLPVVVVYGDTTNETITTFAENTNSHIKISGNYLGKKMVIGYAYDMSIELPKFYLVQASGEGRFNADTTSNLIIHRLKIKTGLSGSVDYKVKILGITDRTQTITALQANRYLLNSVNLTEGSTHILPLYQRNKNLSVTIEGNTPYPVTIESLNWEGRYATNFYKRA